MIQFLRTEYPLHRLCQVLEVSVSGYYAWCTRQASETTARRRQERADLQRKVRALFVDHHGRYGSPRIHQALRRQGVRCSRKRVEQLMRTAGLRARAQRRHHVQTTDSRHSRPVAPNLLNQHFVADAPNRTWVTDFTYIRTNNGWLYLAIVLDLCTRKVIGWKMSEQMTTDLVSEALTMALQQQKPLPGCLIHSDRGSQYADQRYQALLARHGLTCSMSRTGNCYDNAPAESFFSTLKAELIEVQEFVTQRHARSAILCYVEGYYNRTRLHSALGYRTPNEMEAHYMATDSRHQQSVSHTAVPLAA
jgi:putative transposase